MREKPAPPAYPPKTAVRAMLDGKELFNSTGHKCFWDIKTNSFMKKTDDEYYMALNRFDDLREEPHDTKCKIG